MFSKACSADFLSRSPPSRLEELPDSDRKPSGISLRGATHAKIPDIANQPLNTLLPITRDDVPHSQPYYITQVRGKIGGEMFNFFPEHSPSTWTGPATLAGSKLTSAESANKLTTEKFFGFGAVE